MPGPGSWGQTPWVHSLQRPDLLDARHQGSYPGIIEGDVGRSHPQPFLPARTPGYECLQRGGKRIRQDRGSISHDQRLVAPGGHWPAKERRLEICQPADRAAAAFADGLGDMPFAAHEHLEIAMRVEQSLRRFPVARAVLDSDDR